MSILLTTRCTQILTPLVVSGQPLVSERLYSPVAMNVWCDVISQYNTAIWLWMQKHDKHIKARASLYVKSPHTCHMGCRVMLVQQTLQSSWLPSATAYTRA
jgi:hypothetical protein